MTFNECCDVIAKKKGFINYRDFCKKALVSTYMMQEICKLYAKEKVNEAVKLARERGEPISSHYYQYTEEEILKQLEI